MATPFLGLTAEQHREYAAKARSEASVEIEIARIAKIAARTAEAWRAHRDANASQAKRETRNDKGPAPAQEKPRSWAVPTPGRLESMAALGTLAIWFQQQKLVKQTYWTAQLLDEIQGNIFAAGDIAMELGYVVEEQGVEEEQEEEHCGGMANQMVVEEQEEEETEPDQQGEVQGVAEKLIQEKEPDQQGEVQGVKEKPNQEKEPEQQEGGKKRRMDGGRARVMGSGEAHGRRRRSRPIREREREKEKDISILGFWHAA